MFPRPTLINMSSLLSNIIILLNLSRLISLLLITTSRRTNTKVNRRVKRLNHHHILMRQRQRHTTRLNHRRHPMVHQPITTSSNSIVTPIRTRHRGTSHRHTNFLRHLNPNPTLPSTRFLFPVNKTTTRTNNISHRRHKGKPRITLQFDRDHRHIPPFNTQTPLSNGASLSPSTRTFTTGPYNDFAQFLRVIAIFHPNTHNTDRNT